MIPAFGVLGWGATLRPQTLVVLSSCGSYFTGLSCLGTLERIHLEREGAWAE